MIETGDRLLNPEQKQELQRDFKGVWIPKEVWLDENLTPLDKIILVEINSLDTDDGCYASNEYLAEFCRCSQDKVTNTISKLKKLGYVEQVSFNGRCRVLRSRLLNFNRQTLKKAEADSENLRGYNNNINNNIVDNNKSINIDLYNIAEKPKKQSFTKPTIEELKAYNQEKDLRIDCEEFFDYYEAKGWRLKGGDKMVSWQATMRRWARFREKDSQKGVNQNGTIKGKYADFVGETFEV